MKFCYLEDEVVNAVWIVANRPHCPMNEWMNEWKALEKGDKFLKNKIISGSDKDNSMSNNLGVKSIEFILFLCKIVSIGLVVQLPI